MNRIESSKFYYPQNYSKNNHKKTDLAAGQSFTSLPSDAAKDLSKLQENVIYDTLIKEYMGGKKHLWMGDFLNMLSRTAGEMQNIWIIGAGTAFVAPIFIAHNPLSKEDKNSKKYSAWRQPISAVIAMATSLGINYPIAQWFNKAAKEGRIERFNMKAAPPKDYIRTRYTKIERHLKHGRSLDKLGPKEKELLIKAGGMDIKTLEEFQGKYPSYEVLVSKVYETTKTDYAKELLDPGNKKGLRNMTLKEFLITNLGFEEDYVNPEYLNPDNVKQKIVEIKGMTFIKELGIDELDENTLRKYLGEHFYKEKFDRILQHSDEFSASIFNKFSDAISNPKIEFKTLDERKLAEIFSDSTKNGTDVLKVMHTYFIKIAEENKDRELQFKEFKKIVNDYFKTTPFTSSQKKQISRIGELLIPGKIKDEETIPLKLLLKVLKIDDDFYKNTEVLNQTMAEFLTWIDREMDIQFLKALKDEGYNALKHPITRLSSEERLLQFAKQIGTNIAKKGENALKSYSKVQGIVLSLLVLPASCTALNWAYPRFMNKFRPELAKSKADSKGGK